MNIIPSASCSSCMIHAETQEHFLFECFVSKNFWFNVFELWKTKCNLLSQALINCKTITFGVCNEIPHNRNIAFNIIILLGKAYLWNAKQNNLNVSSSIFVSYIRNTVSCYRQNVEVETILK